MSVLIPTRALSPSSSAYPRGFHRGKAGGLPTVDADLIADNIKYGVMIFGILGTMVQWIYDLHYPELAKLVVPDMPSLSVASVVDSSGGGHTATPTLTIPTAPPINVSEVALIDQGYESGDDGDFSIEGVNWEAQTFTTNQAHNIEIIEILCRRVLNPGNVTIGIRATAAGLPTGADLTSVTFDGNALSAANAWIARYVAAQALVAATKYAIVIRAPAGDGANYLVWRKDGTAPGYAGGARCLSANSGVDWAEDINTDFMFREGEVI